MKRGGGQPCLRRRMHAQGCISGMANRAEHAGWAPISGLVLLGQAATCVHPLGTAWSAPQQAGCRRPRPNPLCRSPVTTIHTVRSRRASYDSCTTCSEEAPATATASCSDSATCSEVNPVARCSHSRAAWRRPRGGWTGR